MTLDNTTDRGQSGLDRLVLFLLAVLVVVLVTPTVLQFAGVDVRESGADGAVRLAVLGAEGDAIDDSRTSVGTVRVVVVTNTGDGRIDPSTLTATWIGNGSYSLIAAGTDGDGDGTFTVSPLDGDREDAVLREHGDRAILTFDLGTDDVAGAAEFGNRLRSGETATVSLMAPEGSTATTDLFVSDPLPAGDSIAL